MSRRLADLMVDADDDTVTKTEVDDLNSVSIYPYKRRRLPQEIIFEILLRLPAQVIHDKRYVYEEWKLMTGAKDFIYSHLWNSTPGILIMENHKNYGIYVEMRRGCLEICKFDCGSFQLIGNSVNGLVLATPKDKESRDKQILSVFNPLTKQHVGVPYDDSVIFSTTLAFAEASMKYKVVRSCHPKSSWCVGLLTIGVDEEWRYIDIQHISMLAQSVLWNEPRVTRGYVHWIDSLIVLTLDVETEVIYEFAKPEFGPRRGFLAMGHNIFFYHLPRQPKSHEYLMEVWEMNSETGEWTMLFTSDLKPLSDRFKGLNSINVFGMLASGEVLLFGIVGSEKLCGAYNVRTRDVQWIQLEKCASKYYPIPHVNSMVWLE
ncbi:uncharacterized protein [Henckelia pumila]|uniref:uncharacterized protein isoform X2 n=1 Tax=Henckelia pumila TaxID=405737 RepID=UPI003C6DC48A